MNDSRDFKDAESVRSGLCHVPSQLALFPRFRDPVGMLSRSVGMLSRNDKPPDNWDTHGISGNVFFFFLQIQRRVLQHLIRKSPILGSPMYQNTHHSM